MPSAKGIAAPSRKELLDLRNGGMQREQMAEHYNVGVHIIKKWIRDAQLPPPPASVRSKRLKKIKMPQGMPYDGAPSKLEQAKTILADRLTERVGFGYYLDGRPASAFAVLQAAGFSVEP